MPAVRLPDLRIPRLGDVIDGARKVLGNPKPEEEEGCLELA
jgi:hypothetical protein